MRQHIYVRPNRGGRRSSSPDAYHRDKTCRYINGKNVRERTVLFAARSRLTACSECVSDEMEQRIESATVYECECGEKRMESADDPLVHCRNMDCLLADRTMVPAE